MDSEEEQLPIKDNPLLRAPKMDIEVEYTIMYCLDHLTHSIIKTKQAQNILSGHSQG